MQVTSDSYYHSTSPIPESTHFALAQVDDTGKITSINASGVAIWGWKIGDRLPENIVADLTRDGSTVLHIKQARDSHSISVPQTGGWLLVGQRNNGPTSAPTQSSIKTLIENHSPLHPPFSSHAPQGILFLDRKGGILFSNQKFQDFFPREDQYFTTELSFLDLSFETSLNEKIHRLLNEQVSSIQDTLSLEEGRYDLSVFGTPVYDTHDTILGVILSFEIHHPPNGSAYKATLQLSPGSRIAQLKNVFVTMMSHEIRTPLGVMNGYAEILSQELIDYETGTGNTLPPQIKEFVSAIHENAQRILGLVNELFDLSNMRQLSLTPISLHETILPVTERARQLLQEKGVRFELQLLKESPIILGNPHRLAQVIQHLLSNAVKFTDEGSITLSTSLRNSSEVILDITDTGIGIAQEYLDQLFTPFVQEDMRLNRKFEGAGVGLALVKLLIDLMNGRIEVQSEKDKGSTFRIILPLAQP